MQEHYLDTTSDYSKWGKELDYKIKGDVVPESIFFDLDEIEKILEVTGANLLFCDRNNPCFFVTNGTKYIAPNGGNFLLRSSILKENIHKIRFLKSTFENTYSWAVFCEYFGGGNIFSKWPNSI